MCEKHCGELVAVIFAVCGNPLYKVTTFTKADSKPIEAFLRYSFALVAHWPSGRKAIDDDVLALEG